MLLNLDVHEAMTPESRKNTKENIQDLDLIPKKKVKNITGINETLRIKEIEVVVNKRREETKVKVNTDKKNLVKEAFKMRSKRDLFANKKRGMSQIMTSKDAILPKNLMIKILTLRKDVRYKEFVEMMMRKLIRCNRTFKSK